MFLHVELAKTILLIDHAMQHWLSCLCTYLSCPFLIQMFLHVCAHACPVHHFWSRCSSMQHWLYVYAHTSVLCPSDTDVPPCHWLSFLCTCFCPMSIISDTDAPPCQDAKLSRTISHGLPLLLFFSNFPVVTAFSCFPSPDMPIECGLENNKCLIVLGVLGDILNNEHMLLGVEFIKTIKNLHGWISFNEQMLVGKE